MICGRRISSFVITYNEQDNIGECLESLQWTDEIVVVDSYSTDATVDIARDFTDRVLQREFAGHVDQTRYASQQTTHPWVLWLDADERMTQEAFEEVHQAMSAGGEDPAGYAFPRRTYFMGCWITHSGWYPQPKVRLWQRDRGEVVGEEPHPKVQLEGPRRVLHGDILHYSYPGGMKDMVETSKKYAWYAARERHKKGRRFSFLSLLLKPPGNFLKKYVLQLGMLDGLPGLAIAVGAAYYRFMREIMMWELENPHSRPQFIPPRESQRSPGERD